MENTVNTLMSSAYTIETVRDNIKKNPSKLSPSSISDLAKSKALYMQAGRDIMEGASAKEKIKLLRKQKASKGLHMKTS